MFQVYAEEPASEGDDHDDDDCDGYDYDGDYSSDERTSSPQTHHKKQHMDKTTEERVTHSHDKMGHQAELSAGSVGIIRFLLYRLNPGLVTLQRSKNTSYGPKIN